MYNFLMRIYISGISGTGMGPLAIMAKEAGMEVVGSDLSRGAISSELDKNGIEFMVGKQDGRFLAKKAGISRGDASVENFSAEKVETSRRAASVEDFLTEKVKASRRAASVEDFSTEKVGGEPEKARADFEGAPGVDWFVYTSALPEDHSELVLAKKLGIRCSKRDELIAFLVEKLKLKMVAVAGTHGKTTTTSMIIWVALRIGLPISYLTGTTLSFAGAGRYEPGSKFLIYEADEYDRNFLHFHPWLAVITTVSYDHPDIYPTIEDYRAAFRQFEEQSESVIYGESGGSDEEGAEKIGAKMGDGLGSFNAEAGSSASDFKLAGKAEFSAGDFKLAGKARREDAALAFRAILRMAEEIGMEVSRAELKRVLDDFPGAGRRFEKIAEGIYSDYGHHPEEIAATVEMAHEEAKLKEFKGVVAVYEPHQNVRQHEVFDGYRTAFLGVEKLYWLPTFLTRENPDLEVIRPEKFIESLENAEVGEAAEMDATTIRKLHEWREKGFLVLLMSAGPADEWLREGFKGEDESLSSEAESRFEAEEESKAGARLEVGGNSGTGAHSISGVEGESEAR